KRWLGTVSLRVLGPGQPVWTVMGIIRTLGLGALSLWAMGVCESALVLGSYGGGEPPRLLPRACRVHPRSGPDRLDTARSRGGMPAQVLRCFPPVLSRRGGVLSGRQRAEYVCDF